MTNWNKLETKEEWADVLSDLLEEAEDSVSAQSAARRTAAKRDLREFVEQSPFEIGLEYDDIARKAIDSITKAELAADLATVESIALDLAQTAKRLDAVSAKNEQAAATLRLEKARAAVDSITGTVVDLQRLKASFEQEGSNPKLLENLRTALEALKKLRGALESLS